MIPHTQAGPHEISEARESGLSSRALTPETYQAYLQALLAGQRSDCREIVKTLLQADMPVAEIYQQLFTRSLYEIGNLWQTNRISVATEHLATTITENLFSLFYPRIFEAERIGKSVVLACVPQEQHPIGLKMVADIFELYGWDSYYLGANMPTADLLAMMATRQPDLLGFSISLSDKLEGLQQTLDEVMRYYPDLPVIVGGQVFSGQEQPVFRHPNVKYIASLAGLIQTVIQA